MTAATKLCKGEPPGTCMVIIPVERVWCRGCTTRRQESLHHGLPVGIPTPVGIVLEDFEAPRLQCKCGGAADGFRHVESLRHRVWAFGMQPQPAPRDSDTSTTEVARIS